MLFLVFSLGADRYALEASQIAEVLPLVDVRPLPHAPEGIAGVFDLRGVAVPVLDLSTLVAGRPSARSLSTRMVVVDYLDAAGNRRSLGLIAEKATRTVHREASDFQECGVSHDRAWYLGPVARDAEGLMQWVDVSQLLPAAVRDALFAPREAGR